MKDIDKLDLAHIYKLNPEKKIIELEGEESDKFFENKGEYIKQLYIEHCKSGKGEVSFYREQLMANVTINYFTQNNLPQEFSTFRKLKQEIHYKVSVDGVEPYNFSDFHEPYSRDHLL